MFIRSNLKHLRKNFLLTQAQVATEIGISSVTYNNYESGRLEVNIPTLLKLCIRYGVSLDDMVNCDLTTISDYGISGNAIGSNHGIIANGGVVTHSPVSINKNTEDEVTAVKITALEQRIIDLEVQLRSKDDTIAIQKELIEVLKQKNTPPQE